MAIAAMDRASARGGFADSLALLAGVLLLALTIAFCALVVVDVVARYGANRPILGAEYLEIVEAYVGPAFAAASLLALPAALAASFARRGDHPAGARSTLALVPGCPLALAVAIVGFLLIVHVMGLDIDGAGQLLLNLGARNFASVTMLFAPIVIMLAAVLGGAGSPAATAAVAAPTMLIWLFAVTTENSIARLMTAMFVPLLLTTPAVAAVYAVAPARAVTPWLLGAVLPIAMFLPLALGFLTPTETAAFFVLLGLVIAIPVRLIALGQEFRPVLRQAATEAAALATVVLAASVLSFLFSLWEVPAAITKTLGSWEAAPFVVFAVAAAAIVFVSYFLTPAFTLAVGVALLMPTIMAFALDPVYFGVVALLLGLAALIARSGRRDAGAGSLTPAAALIAAGAALAVAIVVTLVPAIALWLVMSLQG